MKPVAFKQAILFAVFSLAAVTAMAQSPVSVVEDAANALSQQLDGRKDELRNDRKALYSLINGILLPRFDRNYSAQLVLGRYWRSANDAQRSRFVEAFYQNLLHKYADGVLEFDQSKFEILPFRGDDSESRPTVQTIVKLEDGTKVPVNYSLVKRNSGWLMFDVTIEGISYVRNFRAEMNTEFSTKGLDAVIDRLESEAEITPPS
jgi:phospholipid transport system substrate-binding protein